MRSFFQLQGTLAVVFLASLIGGCDGGELTPPIERPPVPVPMVGSLSTYSAAVGDTIRFTGAGFISPDQGWTEVTFRGAYEHDGISEPVNFAIELDHESDGALVWHRFGPYQIPFSRAGNTLGTFEGEVFATNFSYDGREQRQEQGTFHGLSFQVLPSLVIRDLHAGGVSDTGTPFESSCNFTGTRLLNFVPYQMQVEAVGFSPSSFTYTISAGLMGETGPAQESTSVEHLATTTIDSLGDIEDFRFAEVPMGVPVYRASVTIDAVADDGSHFEQLLMVTVHQPLYVRYLGGVEIAEIMEAQPVSGCLHGGLNGTTVTYSEMTSDVRTISSTETFSTGWQDTYTESHTDTYGEAGSEVNKIGFSTQDQRNWNWNVNGSVMAGGEAGVPLVANGKVELRVGAGRDWGGSHTDTTVGEQSWQQTASYSAALAQTEAHAETITQARSEMWSITSSHSESLGISQFLLPNYFGVFYRQTTRMIRQGEIIAMDLCGNETIIGTIVLNDYTWAPDFAMGTACPPLPESGMPPAQCLIPPCDEIR
jgi:hypothetical protein